MVYFMHPFYNTIIMKKALFVYFALITYCFLSCSEKPDMLFYCCVFNEVFRFFALLRPL